MNVSRNDRTLTPKDRLRDDTAYALYESAQQPYTEKIKPLLDTANKPVERLDLDDLEKKLKIYSVSYQEGLNTFYRFLVLTHAKPNSDAEERWKAADERVGISFRNLRTFPETAAIMERWRSNSVVNAPLYDWYRNRMRELEAITNAK
jgi:hypothetical protein